MLNLVVRRKNMQKKKFFFFVILQHKSYDNYTFFLVRININLFNFITN